MTIYLEDYEPVVKEQGLNTNKAVTLGSTLASGAQTITSSSASALAVGQSGATNSATAVPALLVNASTDKQTGLSIASDAAGNGVTLQVLSTSSNEGLNINAKGSGTVLYQSPTRIAYANSSAFQVTSSNSNPVLQVDTSASSNATGVAITSAASGSGVTLSALGGTNETLLIKSKGTGAVRIAPASNNTTAFLVSNAALSSNYLVVDTSTPLVNMGARLQIYTNSSLALNVGPNGDTNPVLTVDASVASQATGLLVQGKAAAGNVLLAVQSSGAAEGMVLQAKNSSNSLTINDTLAAATSPLLVGIATDTTTGAVTDGFTGALRLTPTINGANTVTRHNYMDIKNTAGAATVTDACVMRFDAAAGTHKAVDGATAKTTPGTVNAWVKINVNGTLYYLPAYTSKTS